MNEIVYEFEENFFHSIYKLNEQFENIHQNKITNKKIVYLEYLSYENINIKLK